jgi:hypothetical protein
MANGKGGGDSLGRATLMRILAGELITGKTSETYRNMAMERGITDEPLAREWYQRTNFVELRQVGFARRKLPSGRFVGCSPDALVGTNKALEIKTTRADLLIAMMDKGAAAFPAEHRAQCQGTIWVADLVELDLVIFCDNELPKLKFRIERDETYIKEVSNAVEVFDWELNKLVERIKHLGR